MAKRTKKAKTAKQARTTKQAKPKWDVAKAVSSVIRAINRGAPGIDLASDAEASLRKYYTGTFQEMHDDGFDWNKDKRVVLVLSHAVGMLGALCELLRSLPESPTELSREMAVLAAYVIAQSKLCPKPDERGTGRKVILGGWCTPPPKKKATQQIVGMAAALAPLVRPALARGSRKRGARKGAKRTASRRPSARRAQTGA